MSYRMRTGLVIAVLALAPVEQAAAQGRGGGGGGGGVNGSGTPGTVPVWTGSGTTLTNSGITDNGTQVSVQRPVVVSGEISGSSTTSTAISGHTSAGFGTFGVYGSTGSAADGTTGVGGASTATTGITFGVQGFANSPDGAGVQGNNSAGGTGVAGFSLEDNGAGIEGFGSYAGVQGRGSAEISWGVTGVSTGTAGVGVEGFSGNVGVRGQSLECDSAGCTPKAGVAGQFVAGAGGTLLHGFLSNFNGPGGWDEKFKVDAAGNLSIYGNAFKPGGGSWSTLSDRRAKQNIAPISKPLEKLLRLNGVSYEYSNPAAFGEMPGTHLGMVAQDVEQVFPSWVDMSSDGYRRLTFRGFEAVAVEAVRELDNRTRTESERTSSRINALEKQNAELRRQIETLTETMRLMRQSR